MNPPRTVEEEWRLILTGEHPILRRGRRFYRLLPANPRCKWCNAPFSGVGGRLMALMGKTPSNLNPRYCNICENFTRNHLGGTEIDLSMLFADVRGSTTLAEKMQISDFSRLISRFYATATDILMQSDALIDKLVGDQATGFYVSGLAGKDHALVAIQAAQALLSATGNTGQAEPWIPVGIGMHTGRAFMGAVGSESGVVDVTALGDAVNVAARLSSLAGPGEILVSEDAGQAAGLDLRKAESRLLDVKGKSHPVPVRVLNSGTVLSKVFDTQAG